MCKKFSPSCVIWSTICGLIVGSSHLYVMHVKNLSYYFNVLQYKYCGTNGHLFVIYVRTLSLSHLEEASLQSYWRHPFQCVACNKSLTPCGCLEMHQCTQRSGSCVRRSISIYIMEYIHSLIVCISGWVWSWVLLNIYPLTW
jgi:hypothetical protein